jgi:hypothetical protein
MAARGGAARSRADRRTSSLPHPTGADDVIGFPIPAGHFMPEEAPVETLDLVPFLREVGE